MALCVHRSENIVFAQVPLHINIIVTYYNTLFVYSGKFVNRHKIVKMCVLLQYYLQWWFYVVVGILYVYADKSYNGTIELNAESAPQTPFASCYTVLVSFFFFSPFFYLQYKRTNKPICIWKLSENLPFNMWTRTDIGLAFDGAHVYRPESLCIAFWTKSRLVVSLPFSVTKEMPPLGESKFITWKRTQNITYTHKHKKWNKINILIFIDYIK